MANPTVEMVKARQRALDARSTEQIEEMKEQIDKLMSLATNYTNIAIVFLNIIESVIPRTFLLEDLVKKMQGGGTGFAEAVNSMMKYDVPQIPEGTEDQIMDMINSVRATIVKDQAEIGITPYGVSMGDILTPPTDDQG